MENGLRYVDLSGVWRCEIPGQTADMLVPGTEDLILYLQTLYEPDDYVGYVTGDVWQTDDGKWVPSKGVYYRTAGELITSLHRYPDDLGATVGDWKDCPFRGANQAGSNRCRP